MKHYVFDLETNGLMSRDDLVLHCIVAVDAHTGAVHAFGPDRLQEGMRLLMHADRLIGHNISEFDLPVLERLYPETWKYRGEIFDTLLASRLIYISNMYERSIKCRNAAGRSEKARDARLPAKFLKSHSLEAWGYRLKFPKDTEFSSQPNAFEHYSPRMLEYCITDVQLNNILYDYLLTTPAERDWPVCSEESLLIESYVGYVLGKQQRNGVGFNEAEAIVLASELLEKRNVLKLRLREFFPPWFVPVPGQNGSCAEADALSQRSREVNGRSDLARYSVPKRSRMMKKEQPWPVHYEAGCPHTKIKLVEFNPGSEQHIADRLKTLYGWEPKDFTPTGQPVVDEKTIAALDYEPVPLLLEYMVVDKRLGQLSEGKQAWLKCYRPDTGTIHGRVHVTGARTNRMTHQRPNLAQVPRVTSPYGVECRSLFLPTREGWVMVGADASGIELRFLAHRLAYYDNGAFGKVLLEGDPHTEWMKSTGIFIRDNQKTYTYAMLYGAGDEKLGMILLHDWRMAHDQGLTQEKPPSVRFARELGKNARGNLLRDLPALDILQRRLKKAFKRGWIQGIDGRVIACGAEHTGLNDLLQGDAATAMKHALVILDKDLTERGWVHGRDFAYLLNVHDEWQAETSETHADSIGESMVRAIRRAGEKLEVRVPLDGEYKVGRTWAETH